MAWLPAGHSLVTIGEDAVVKVWDAERFKCVREFTGGAPLGGGLALSADGRRLLTYASDGIRLWNLDQMQGTPASRRVGRSWAILSRDGSTLATSRPKGPIEVWDAASLKPIQRFPPGVGIENRRATDHPDVVMAFSSDNQLLARSVSGEVTIFDPHGARAAISMAPRGGRLESMTFSPDNGVVASTYSDATILLWDVRAISGP